MSDLISDLRELHIQMATIVDDETILGVFARAIKEIERLNGRVDELTRFLPSRHFIAWRLDTERECIVGPSKQQDDDTPLLYMIHWDDTRGGWVSTFEGADVESGSLIDCMWECEREERTQ